MLDQPAIVKGHVAFMFVLLLCSANLASTNPICPGCQNNTADSPTKKVVDFNVQISESGAQYNETIEVDTEKQTELFKVPAHSNVEHSNILHDFKTNMSLLLLPEKNICYLLPLQDELMTPKQLINDLDKAEKSSSPISVKRTIENKWTMGKEMTDRSVLSDELANFCAKYPIYYVKQMEDSMTTTRIETRGRKTRKRRQISISHRRYMIIQAANSYRTIPSDKLCLGGKDRPTERDEEECVWEQWKQWKVKCQIRSRTCYEIDVCETLDVCYKRHIINNIFCCQYVCL